jgi:peroxiredoxin
MRFDFLPPLKTVLFLLLFALGAYGAPAKHAADAPHGAVVRLAPDFTFPGPGNKAQSLRSLRGQPVVLLVTDSPRTKAYRKQLKLLRNGYQLFASRSAVFVAAFKDGSAGPVESNIPFTVANNGGAVVSSYGVNDDYNLIIIGKDGNVDYQTSIPRTADRIKDVVQNSYEVQAISRKPVPSKSGG